MYEIAVIENNVTIKRFAEGHVVIQASPDGAVSYDTPVSIKCTFNITTIEPASMKWSHDGVEVESNLNNAKYNIVHQPKEPPETIITIPHCGEGDAGIWQCTATFTNKRMIGVPRSSSYTAESRYHLKVGVPRIQNISGELVTSVGQLVNLKCNATGDPEPRVSWTTSSSSSNHPSGNLTAPDEELSFTVMEVSDGGNYMCIAVNILGRDNATVRVHVNHAPTFPASQQPSVIRGRVGVLVTLSVTVSAYPYPSVTWYKEGVPITDASLLTSNKVEGIYSLQFVPDHTNFGRYSCTLENKFGRIEQSILLIPAGPPLTPLSVTSSSVTLTSIILHVDSPIIAGGNPTTMFKIVYREIGRVTMVLKQFPATQEIYSLGFERRLHTPSLFPLVIKPDGAIIPKYFSFQREWHQVVVTTPSPGNVPTTLSQGPSLNNTDTNNTLPTAPSAGFTSVVNPPATQSSNPTTLPVQPGKHNESFTQTSAPGQTVDRMTSKAVRHSQTPLIEVIPDVNASLPNSSNSQGNVTEGDLTPSRPASQKSAIVIICLVLVSIVCMMIVGFCLFMASTLPVNRWLKRRRKPNDNMRDSLYERPTSLTSDCSIQYRIRPFPSLISSFFMTPPVNIEFPRERLHLKNLIGQGSFGVVYQAEAVGIVQSNVSTSVAVKMLREDYNEIHEVGFQKELEVMMRLKPHPFIVTLFGCCTTSEPQMIIMEYLSLGNLLTHLRQSRQHVTNQITQRVSLSTTLSPTDLIKYGYEIANGMSYLASMKCIHRDLAARNILRSGEDVCKLSNFSHSRDVIKDGIAHRKTQGRSSIRWMATESLLENAFTIRSNVWSFGVLLWEIVTIGSYPYAGITSGKLTRFLQDGKRMTKPDHCSNEIYSLMMQCWQTDPRKRPTFDDLSRRLEAVLSESRNYLVLEGFEDCIYECAENLPK
ncbi:fibroblast growth factor receptor 2 [Apostichopus japonicus]|uniref:receptor protein-tyrosine kinase n=1 Tax=Stichopus japonicus TaxID=307972 RepID=A0A2G8LM66_STIJA|nr:fibroblast growth factor receptor 2 [Apostichopus japonicus]